MIGSLRTNSQPVPSHHYISLTPIIAQCPWLPSSLQDKDGIPQIYTTKWWFGCFLDRVPFPLALRIWDVFMLDGDVILLAMAHNIFKMHRSESLTFSVLVDSSLCSLSFRLVRVHALPLCVVFGAFSVHRTLLFESRVFYVTRRALMVRNATV